MCVYSGFIQKSEILQTLIFEHQHYISHKWKFHNYSYVIGHHQNTGTLKIYKTDFRLCVYDVYKT